MTTWYPSRRGLLQAGGVVAVTAACGPSVVRADEASPSPGEELMREHGVIGRVLLAFDEVVRRLDAGGPVPRDPLSDSVDLVRRFVQDYHEQIEEDGVFVRLRRAGQQVDLIGVLVDQHRVGRVLTDRIRTAVAGGAGTTSRQQLRRDLLAFSAMYRAHAAREDTVLYSALRRLLGDDEWDELGNAFEERRRRLLGKRGWEESLERMAAIERDLDIGDLARYTPPTAPGRA